MDNALAAALARADGMPLPTPCSACLTVDATDDYLDNIHHARPERKILSGLLRAQDRAADSVTNFAGSLKFVYIHSVWFGLWVSINAGIAGAGLKFDKYPYGLLTMVVSLEAIFLATFVMVSQNRQAARSDLRSELDFETNLRSEIWSIHIGHALGVEPDHVEQVVQAAIARARASQGVTPT